MARSSRVRWLLLVLGVIVAWAAQTRPAEARVKGNIGTSLEQCQNGTTGVVDCTGSAWITGDLNAQHSLYSEGDFVPFRSQITGLTAETNYTLGIGYDAVVSGLHAYDYLGSVDYSEAPGQQIVPCDGVAGTAGPHACGAGPVPGQPSTLLVPIDKDTHFPSGFQVPGVFSAWGGQLRAAAYVSPTPIDVNTPGTVAREIDVSFTADGGTVVLAWGGHLASNLDWGAGNTFVTSRSGAPFHMRLVPTSSIQAGSQERSIHGDVIAPAPAPFTTQVMPSTAAVGQTVIDTASLSGTSGPPAGSVAFFVCFDAGVRPDCTSGGALVQQSGVIVSRSRAHHRRRRRAVSTGVASASFVPTVPGFYCFRAEYTPAAGASYSPWSHTDMTSECFEATPPPPTLSVAKICELPSDPGLFNLVIDTTVVFPNAPCGASTDPLVQTVGLHTVSETAGTGTSLSDYTATIGGDCMPNGSIMLAAGQSATCTITNARNPPPPMATLTVNKVCQPTNDDGRFDLYIDTTLFADVACGGSTGAVTLPVGPHMVSEQGGTDTSLDDYTTVIGGDCATNGTITLSAGQSATCTITNTRKPMPPTTITVDKACVPSDDSGRFNLTIDGRTAGSGANIGCGGSTGAVAVAPGSYVVGETPAGDTDLGDYTTIIGGDCAADGSVLVAQGDQATCTILNVRQDPKPPPFALLTVNKICVPTSDGGLFNLFIGNHVERDEPCGGSLGPLAVTVGTHQVSETGGTGTDLAHYTTTIGGACSADGSVTLAAGQSAICTITNALNPPQPTATIAVKKVCVPATTRQRFSLHLDEQLLPAMACGQSTGAMQVSIGLHVVGEVAATTNPAAYQTVIGGDCAADGSITLTANQHATCTVTNTRRHIPAPPRPPTICHTLRVTPRTVIVGQPRTITAYVAARGKPVLGAQVTLKGPGNFDQRYTSARGTVNLPVRPVKAGVLRLTTQRQFGCREAAKDRIKAIIHRPRPPSFTG
jgi:hypothetical protein